MHDYNKEDQSLFDEAMSFVRIKKNKKKIAKKLVDSLPEEESPVSVFMAGSPGAGKTEVAKSLVESFGGNTLRIDNDELRNEFEGYTGGNSHLFQSAATRLVEAVHDRALKKKVSFILDTTLSCYEVAKKNIERSLNKDRAVMIIFVYQSPQNAWAFVQAREKVEGRRVPPDVFVKQFIDSQLVVNKLKAEFQKQIRVEVLVKDLTEQKAYHCNVSTVDQYLENKYNTASLNSIVNNKSEC
ncbi:zeta toxin family protein [Psychromonas sp. Urea-02u-13]|uniref:zeta toxin family protein n=1 Tax=Psychromonas sp. Urea-02u-13 TaxID=2058326 RepID=UPI000C34504D|nr:zeta toxin family protein [Psychromonas sp. Urea-02u-13]PKG36980.1 zeta toxin family protein [Psychromonas sp. Urea-02u-13]